MQVNITDLINDDSERFLNQFADYGYKSRQEMLRDAIHHLRIHLRQQATNHLPEVV